MAIVVDAEYSYNQIHDSGILRIYVRRSGGAFSGSGVILNSSGVLYITSDILADFPAAATNLISGHCVAVADNDASTATELAAFYDSNTGNLILQKLSGLSATSQIEFFAEFLTT